MTEQEKDYIEKHIDLIENNDWETFFKGCPWGIGSVLYDAGIDFMSDMMAVPRNCFAFTDINSIIIPEGVTRIGYSAFCNCKNLKNITIPNSVTYIGSCIFEDCSSLTNINIPDGVTRIEYGAFQNCSRLTSITIPNNVMRIGNLAFYGCLSLRTVRFTGTVEQWREITQLEDAFTNVPAQEALCSDGVTNLR